MERYGGSRENDVCTCRLVQFFADAFEEKKRSKHLIDFSDMEQYALRILTEKTEEGSSLLRPRKIIRKICGSY